MRNARLLTALLAIPSLPALANAADWPQWRGPNANGTTDEPNLPSTFSTKENVAWVTPLPGPAESTPAIANGKIFISSTANNHQDLVAICLDAATGKQLWQKRLAAGQKLRRNTQASPSPVTDGKSSYFLFGTGQLFALNETGNTTWSRDLTEEVGKIAIQWNYRSSPLLHNGKLYVQAIHSGPSFLLALDPATGKTLWKQPRTTNATGEPQEAYTTPIPYKHGETTGILVAGADALTFHDPDTGKELWRHEASTGRLVTAPIPMGDLICVGRSHGKSLFAVRPGKDKPTEAWAKSDAKPDVATPAFYKSLLYVIDDKSGNLLCLEPETGATVWKEKLPAGSNWASPTIADDKIYCINIKGEVNIFKAGKTPEKLTTIQIGERDCLSTIAIANGHLYIRTAQNLYAITSPPANPRSPAPLKTE
jgi:outer membrane protein assembly factor BamB